MARKTKPKAEQPQQADDDAAHWQAYLAAEAERQRHIHDRTLARAKEALARAPSSERDFAVRAGSAFMSLWRGFEERWITAQFHIAEHQGGYSMTGPVRDRLNGLAAEILSEIRGAPRDGGVRLDEDLRNRDLREAQGHRAS